MGKWTVVTPWHNERQLDEFLGAWKIQPGEVPEYLVLQQDTSREGCAVTKNKGVQEAVRRGAEVVIVLDDDCYPCDPDHSEPISLIGLADCHLAALEDHPVELFQAVTDPPSRGTPYRERSVTVPVAASMGFWTEIGDHCAVRQLALDNAPMSYSRTTIFGRYFPLCGMNLAFRPADWLPWCRFIDVPRFDDIWMGWLWQKEAYRRGACFNLGGPLIRHARQSDVWKNLRDEGVYLKENETLWAEIATSKAMSYIDLIDLLPVGALVGTRA